MLTTSEFVEIKQNLRILLKYNVICSTLTFGENNRLYCSDKLLGIFNRNKNSKNNTFLSIFTHNCGATTNKETMKETNKVIEQYFRFDNSDVYLLNDICLTSSLISFLHDKSWVYVPTLFQENIERSSGLLIITNGEIELCNLILPSLPMQGQRATQKYLEELYYPALTAIISIGTTQIIVASYYVSYFARMSHRLVFHEIMFWEVNRIKRLFPISCVFLGGDSNSFGLTIPFLPKKVANFKFVPTVLIHLITGVFIKQPHNLLSNSELNKLSKLAKENRYKNYPSSFTPTLTKLGVPFMLDHLFFNLDWAVSRYLANRQKTVATPCSVGCAHARRLPWRRLDSHQSGHGFRINSIDCRVPACFDGVVANLGRYR